MTKQELTRIKIKQGYEIKSFDILLNADFATYCLPNNEYVVLPEILNELKKNKIEFELVD